MWLEEMQETAKNHDKVAARWRRRRFKYLVTNQIVCKHCNNPHYPFCATEDNDG